MSRFCLNCEKNTGIAEKKISIPIGNESFRVVTEVCPQCGYYALTPKILREMDEWGMSLKKNIVEPQPFFTKAAHDFAEEIASQYGLKKVPLIRALTTYYLNHIVNRKDFQDIKKYCDHHEAKRLLEKDKKSKVSVPIRYLMYKKLQSFCEVWEIPHAKALEEATLFGLVLLTHEGKNFEKLKNIAASLEQYIAEFAQAA